MSRWINDSDRSEWVVEADLAQRRRESTASLHDAFEIGRQADRLEQAANEALRYGDLPAWRAAWVALHDLPEGARRDRAIADAIAFARQFQPPVPVTPATAPVRALVPAPTLLRYVRQGLADIRVSRRRVAPAAEPAWRALELAHAEAAMPAWGAIAAHLGAIVAADICDYGLQADLMSVGRMLGEYAVAAGVAPPECGFPSPFVAGLERGVEQAVADARRVADTRHRAEAALPPDPTDRLLATRAALADLISSHADRIRATAPGRDHDGELIERDDDPDHEAEVTAALACIAVLEQRLRARTDAICALPPAPPSGWDVWAAWVAG